MDNTQSLWVKVNRKLDGRTIFTFVLLVVSWMAGMVMIVAISKISDMDSLYFLIVWPLLEFILGLLSGRMYQKLTSFFLTHFLSGRGKQ
jgi:hypothetical protein